MAFQQRRILKEFGTAFAVLAIYILTLLLPLHQAAGLQRDLDQLGFQTLQSWSVCSAISQDTDGDPDTPAAVKCPATGIAKQDLAIILPAAIVVEKAGHAQILDVATAGPFHPVISLHFGQSRAPPVAV